MASLQEQIDDLRDDIVALQGSLAARALKSEMNTIANELTTDTNTLITYYDDLNSCVRELQDALLAARQELIDLQES